MSYAHKALKAACLSSLAVLGTTLAAQADTSVALILPGSINDGGWNQGAYLGLQALKDGDFDIAFSENVGQADIPSVVQGYADDGYDLVIGHGYQFGSLFAELAPEYPEQAFFASTSAPGDAEIPANALYLNHRYADIGYAAGVLAALMSETGVIGIVGGGDNPTSQNLADGFAAGAAATVEGTEAFSIVTGDYNDAAKGREAATTMIGNDADVIWHSADITGIGAVNGAKEAGVMALGMFSDQTELAPETLGTSFNPNNTGLVQMVAAMVADETFAGGMTWSPALEELWLVVYGDGDHNPDLVSEADWAAFKTAWDGIEAAAAQ